MFKSKHLFCAQLQTKTGGSFLKRRNPTNTLLQIFFHMKNMSFFGVFGQITVRANQIISKLSTEKNQVLQKKILGNKNFIAAALHAQIWFQRSDQSQSSTPGQPPNGSPVLKYFLSETIHTQENGSRGTISCQILNFQFPLLKGLKYSALMDELLICPSCDCSFSSSLSQIAVMGVQQTIGFSDSYCAM